jgi:hypothetical protein
MQTIKKSEATAAKREIPFICVDATDGVTPETGLTFAAGELQVRKAGGSYANVAGTVTEKAAGEYVYVPTTSEIDTDGVGVLKLVKSGVRNGYFAFQVVGYDPYSSGATETQVAQAVRAEMDTNSTRLDVAVSTRLATAGYTAPTTPPTVAAIRAEMDTNSTKLANLDATVSSRLASAGYTAPPSAVAVRTELDANSTKLANLDATVSSRLATAGYTAPPSAASIASAVWAFVVNGSYTAVQLLRGVAAAAFGKSSNDGKTYRDPSDTKDVLVATVDSNGNRTAVAKDLT